MVFFQEFFKIYVDVVFACMNVHMHVGVYRTKKRLWYLFELELNVVVNNLRCHQGFDVGSSGKAAHAIKL